jgi:hypothetical protein
MNARRYRLIGMLIAASVVLLTGIGCMHHYHEGGIKNSKVNIQNITYFKDERTGLCFASFGSVYGSYGNVFTSITCVPCNENVQKLISKAP